MCAHRSADGWRTKAREADPAGERVGDHHCAGGWTGVGEPAHGAGLRVRKSCSVVEAVASGSPGQVAAVFIGVRLRVREMAIRSKDV